MSILDKPSQFRFYQTSPRNSPSVIAMLTVACCYFLRLESPFDATMRPQSSIPTCPQSPKPNKTTEANLGVRPHYQKTFPPHTMCFFGCLLMRDKGSWLHRNDMRNYRYTNNPPQSPKITAFCTKFKRNHVGRRNLVTSFYPAPLCHRDCRPLTEPALFFLSLS